MNYKKEFYRLREIIQSTGIKIRVYKTKSYFKSNYSTGYVTLLDRPKTIFLAGKTPYKFLLMHLVHEYGHVLDYDRWKHTKRWALYTTYLKEIRNLVKKVPNKTKRAVLYSEFLADEQAKRILKRFKSTYPVELINEHQFINVHIRSFELTYGKEPPQAVGDIFLQNMHQGITKKTFMDLHF